MALASALLSQRRRLLGVADVARYLGVSTSTVYAWRHNRMGPPSLKVGGAVRYRPEDLEAWLESRKSGPQSEPVAGVMPGEVKSGGGVAVGAAPSPIQAGSELLTSLTKAPDHGFSA